MEASDFANEIRETIEIWLREPGELHESEVTTGFGDADFFIQTDEGRFLVTVAKVSE